MLHDHTGQLYILFAISVQVIGYSLKLDIIELASRAHKSSELLGIDDSADVFLKVPQRLKLFQ